MPKTTNGDICDIFLRKTKRTRCALTLHTKQTLLTKNTRDAMETEQERTAGKYRHPSIAHIVLTAYSVYIYVPSRKSINPGQATSRRHYLEKSYTALFCLLRVRTERKGEHNRQANVPRHRLLPVRRGMRETHRPTSIRTLVKDTKSKETLPDIRRFPRGKHLHLRANVRSQRTLEPGPLHLEDAYPACRFSRCRKATRLSP